MGQPNQYTAATSLTTNDYLLGDHYTGTNDVYGNPIYVTLKYPGNLFAASGGLPLATTSQLYGGSGVIGTANIITLGAGLSITGGVLSSTASPPSASSLIGSTGSAFTNVAINGTLTLSGGTLGATVGTAAGTVAAGNDSRIVLGGTSLQPANLPSATNVQLYCGTGTAGTAGIVTLGTSLSISGGVLSCSALTSSALPSATTSQLYGGTGSAGAAQAVTVGTGLSLSGGTLSSSLSIPNASLLQGNGTTLAAVTVGSGLAFGSNTLSVGTLGWSNLPTEAQNLPIPFFFGGVPAASATINVVVPQAITVPANFSGTVVYDSTVATASAVFTLNHITSGNTITAIGTITVTTTNHFSATLSTQASVSIAAGEALQMVAPASPDATLANVCITIQTQKV